jgi:3-oxoacyl-[acyl-carrier protein] reductase
MDLKLKNKTCLVTGSSSGIGIGIAKVLAAEGASVAIHGRDAKRVESVVREIRTMGGTAIAVFGDLTVNADADEVARSALDQLGGVDILVNNVGQGNPRGDVAWLEVLEEEFLQRYEQNVISAVRMIRRLVPQMKLKSWGRVIMISSAGSTQPVSTIPDYQATKAAMVNLTVSLSKALTMSGVTVNCVTPGPILTPLLQGYIRNIGQQRGWEPDDASIERHAIEEFFALTVNRLGRIEEVGSLVAFLASPLADFINGANYRIDGGFIKSVN